VPKITDFGLAKLLERESAPSAPAYRTESGAILGTPSYMAPEQARGLGWAIGPAVDIYALGAILYEALTGRPPFKGTSLLDTLMQVQSQEPVPPGQLQPQLPRDLETICLKCLHKEPQRRYASAEALADDLRRFRAGEPIQARPIGVWERGVKWAKRRPTAAALVAVSSLAILAGGVGVFWHLRSLHAEVFRAETAEGLATDRLEEVSRQKQRAEEEANVARAVNDFLQKDLLGQADIRNQPLLAGVAERNPNFTVGELLDRAAQAIEGKFVGQPLTEAAIRLTLGNTYRALGRYAESQPHLERSVRLRAAQLGADDPETLESKLELAGLYRDQGLYDRAETLSQEALDGYMTRLGADHPATLASKNNLAMLYKLQGKYDQAQTLYQEVVDGRTVQLGADHPDTLITKNNLAELYQTRGQLAKAEPLAKAVLDTRTAKLGADHPYTLASKNNLAVLYRAQGKYDQAETLYKEILDSRANKLGADHPDTLRCQNNLATLYLYQGKLAQAEPLLKEALDGRIAKLGADHPETLSSKNNLAMLYTNQRKYDRAEPLFKEVLDSYSALLGANHPDTLTVKNNLALLYNNLGKYNEAEPLFQAVLDGRAAQLGADHPDTLASKNNLAGAYREQEQYTKAEPLFREAVDGARKKLGPAHPNTQAFIRNLVVCYELMKAPAQAEPLLRELAECSKEKAGADSVPYADLLNLLGWNLLRQQKASEAESVLRESFTIREKQRPDDWATFNIQSRLGRALLGQKKFADAETLLLQGYEGLKQRQAKIPTNGKVNLVDALESLVQLYDAWGQKDKAEEWRKKLEETKAAGPKEEG
jgi:lipopolysaccharide biosynthesis regulator YciM